MAQTIKEIQDTMQAELIAAGNKLSDSKVAEWRLWIFIQATAIHLFEITLDLFRKEMDALTNKITPGTVRWYAEMCYRFQNGHELLFDSKTAMLHYEKDVPEARIIKIVAITEGNNKLTIKAAKKNNVGKIVPLSADEKHNFSGYIDSIKFAGVQTDIISTTEDKIRYDMQVYFEPAVPATTVRDNVLKALEEFKTTLGFDSMLYTQKMLDAVMAAAGVVTVKLNGLHRKGNSDVAFKTVDVFTELESGYYEYDGDSILMLTSVKELQR